MLRRAIQLIAEDAAMHVRVAGSREEGEMWLSREKYDWIVCDHQLMGETSAAFVRARLAEGHRVVVVTGDASRVDPTLGVRVFEKPFRLDRILRELAAPEPPPDPSRS
jgi:DNA-binding response OmpR family regulator